MQGNGPTSAKNELNLRFLFLLSYITWTTTLLSFHLRCNKGPRKRFCCGHQKDGIAVVCSADRLRVSVAAVEGRASPACVSPQLGSYGNPTRVCAGAGWARNPTDGFGEQNSGRVLISPVPSQVHRQAGCIQSNSGQQGANPLFNQPIPDQHVCQHWRTDAGFDLCLHRGMCFSFGLAQICK